MCKFLPWLLPISQETHGGSFCLPKSQFIKLHKQQERLLWMVWYLYMVDEQEQIWREIGRREREDISNPDLFIKESLLGKVMPSLWPKWAVKSSRKWRGEEKVSKENPYNPEGTKTRQIWWNKIYFVQCIPGDLGQNGEAGSWRSSQNQIIPTLLKIVTRSLGFCLRDLQHSKEC